jgi:hypothetical protein
MTTNALGWDNLFFSGSIVDLDINIWSARLSVRPADLGIEDTAAVREALGLGVVRLAPHKAFERLLAIRQAALKDVENSRSTSRSSGAHGTSPRRRSNPCSRNSPPDRRSSSTRSPTSPTATTSSAPRCSP